MDNMGYILSPGTLKFIKLQSIAIRLFHGTFVLW